MGTKAPASHTFTKLVVENLEKSEAFYMDAYGLEGMGRAPTRFGDDPVDQSMLGRDGRVTLVLVQYRERNAPPVGECLLGFETPDLDALLDRIRAAGGGIVVAPLETPALGIRTAFATDPEGHQAELVQLTGPERA